MTTTQRGKLWLGLTVGYLAVVPVFGQSLQAISTVDPARGAPSGGSGDSWAPVLSPDGRYVLFASTANNLMRTTNNAPIHLLIPASLNVYQRDRLTKTTSLVSLNLSVTNGGNGDSLPIALSTNGQYALFESSASDLVPGDTNGASDVFLRDLIAGKTMLVSANTNGVAASGEARSSTMTADGRYVAFVSAANDLVAGDTNRIPDVFVRDTQTGTTVLVSVGAVSTNKSVPVGSSESPQVTTDGRFVAFFSTATNLVSGAPPGGDVYVRDMQNATTVWVSSGARVAVSNALHSTSAVSYNQAVTDDGQFVFYEVSPNTGSAGIILRYGLATGLTDVIHTNAATAYGAFEDFRTIDLTPDGRSIVFIANTNGFSATCVQVWNATSGNVVLVSGGIDGSVDPNSTCDWPSITPDGRFVVFQSGALNLTTNALAGDCHLYRRDLQTGTTLLIDADTNGIGSPISPVTVPSMTEDASLVGFDCPDVELVANDRNHASDVFVRNLNTGTTELVSSHDPSLPTSTANGISLLSAASISHDTHYIAFASEADDLVPNDTNANRDIFVQDTTTGKTLLVSVATNGFSGDATSTGPVLSSDGRYVAFTSSADNLVPGDNNNNQDVFLRDLVTGTTTLVSYNSLATGPGTKGSYSPMIAASGRFILYRSLAANLAGGVFTGENLFVRDLALGTNYALTKTGASLAVMTPDGSYVAYGAPAITPLLYVWSSLKLAPVYTNSVAPTLALTITPDGSRLALANSGGLSVADLAAAVTQQIDSSTFGYSDLSLSTDGRWLAGTKRPALGAANQVYLYDLQNGTNALVSRNPTSADAPDGASDSSIISADGRWVAYRSAASNLVAGDNNGVPDIFVYDLSAGTTTLLSTPPSGSTSGNNRSLVPVFSGDSKALGFTSWASDLTALDFNQSSDVFLYTFLSVSIRPSDVPGQGPWIVWPYSSSKTYKVQFIDSLGDSDWQDLGGTATNSGGKGYLQDPAPSGKQRFYRIRSSGI